MKLTLLLTAGILLSSVRPSYGNAPSIATSCTLPIDSATKKELIKALNDFLVQKEKPNNENKYVLKEDLLEMSALLDEMKGVDKNPKLKNDNFYRAYLTNIVDFGNSHFLVQVSYIGVKEDVPVLRASFRLLAKKQDTSFYFYSPLKQNTIAWKTKKMGGITFHFKDTLDAANAKSYLKTVNFYDKKLNAPSTPFEFYFCDNFPEALRMLGVEYKSNYSGIRYNDLTSHENDITLELNGGYTETKLFDAHDLWHDRLHKVISVDVINRPVDEGCAYLYGGSWGISWDEVLAILKKYASDHPGADWLSLYTNQTKLTDTDKPLYIAYAINALIVQKIEKEKGFAPVMELLSCGKREAGDENYFKALEKVSGISKAGFNRVVWGLIRQ
jgi:hypothetical protein